MGLSDAIFGHPFAVGAVVLFLAIQIAAFWSLQSSLRDSATAFDEIEIFQGEQAPKPNLWRHWMAWCRSEGVHADRDIVVDELSRHVDSLMGYLLLQRTSMMAPLLGVLVTAGGFLTLPTVSGSGNGIEVLSAIIPLAIGVGGGASLAFVGQILLLFADQTADKVHRRAMAWYDDKVASSQPRVSHATMLIELSSQSKEITELLHGLADKESRTADALQNGADRLGTKLLEFGGELDSLVAVLGKATHTVSSLSPVIAEMVGGFDAGVIRFRSAVTDGLEPLLGREVQHSQQLNQIADSTDQAIKNLGQTAEIFASVAKRQDNATSAYVNALETRLVPQSDRLVEAALQIDAAAGTIGQPLSELAGALQNFLSGLAAGTNGFQSLEREAANFAEGVRTHFLPAAQLHHVVADGIGKSIDSFKDSIDLLKTAASDLCDAAKSQSDGSRSLQEAIEKKAVPANTLVERAAMQLGEAAESLSEHVEVYRSQVATQATGVSSLEQTIHMTIASIGTATSSLAGSVEQLQGGPTADLHATLRILTQAANDLKTSVATLRSDAEHAHSLTSSQSNAAQIAQSTLEASGHAASELAAASEALRTTMGGVVQDRQQSLNISVDRLSQATTGLDQLFTSGLGPFAEQMSRLNNSLVQFSAAVERLDGLQALDRHLSKLEGSLVHLADKVASLQELPSRFAAVLHQEGPLTSPIPNGDGPSVTPTPPADWFAGNGKGDSSTDN